MALIVDYDDLEALGRAINTSAGDWFSALENTSNAVKTLSGSPNIKGKAADNVKSYIETVHGSIITALVSIISAHTQNYLLYKREYQGNVDSALHARILQDEILDIKDLVQKNKTKTQEIDITIKNAIADISDIVYLGFPGSSAVESIEEDIIKDITELDDNIVAVENRHYRSDFTETTQLLDALEQLLHQQLGTQRHYKSNFSVDSLGSNKAFLDFAGALSTLAQVQEGKSDAVERAYAEEEQWQERLYEERQREAETINWLVTGLCIVGSVVAIAATGGLATPLAVAAVTGISGASGAILAGTQSLTNQYVTNGDLNDVDWSQFRKDAAVGGTIGAITGAIGSGGSVLISSGISKITPVANLLKSTSAATQVATNIGVGSGFEVLSGMGIRYADSYLSTKDKSAARDSALDVKSILRDAAIGGAFGAVRGLKKPDQIPTPSGEWKAVNESMSDYSRRYQAQIVGGHEGEAYIQNGVKFDGVKDNTLIETKGHYSQFVDKNGRFRKWFLGQQGFVDQATRQMNAADGVPVRWYFAEKSAMKATEILFEEKGISGIEFVFEALK